MKKTRIRFLSFVVSLSLLASLVFLQLYQASSSVVILGEKQYAEHEDSPPTSVTISSNQQDDILNCSNNGATTVEECCASWNTNGDDWWLHHPDWEVSLENDTTYCFAPIQNSEKADFLRNLHQLQWVTGDCSEVEKTVHISSGFGASKSYLLESFYHAYMGDKPFQLVHGKRKWLYATNNTESWAYCSSRDTRCYYLPISKCPRTATTKAEHHRLKPPVVNNNNSTHYYLQELYQYHWLSEYLFRPRQIFRRKIYEMMQQQLDLQYPCTTMHVRRSDAGLPKPPYRRYAAVQEYLDAAHVQRGDNILLLTDDQSTIDEIQQYHKSDYHWMYLNRVRNRGIWGGFDGHVPPSSDEALEMVIIETELKAASSCTKIVHGLSGFMKSMLTAMDLEGRNYTRYYVNTAVSKAEATKFGRDKDARIRSFFQNMTMTTLARKRNNKTTTKVSGYVTVEKPLQRPTTSRKEKDK